MIGYAAAVALAVLAAPPLTAKPADYAAAAADSHRSEANRTLDEGRMPAAVLDFAGFKPGGTVIIIDHAGPGGDTRAAVEKLHRIDPARVKADMIEAGFVLDAETDVLHRSERSAI